MKVIPSDGLFSLDVAVSVLDFLVGDSNLTHRFEIWIELIQVEEVVIPDVARAVGRGEGIMADESCLIRCAAIGPSG